MAVGWEYTVYPRDIKATLVAAGVVDAQEHACWIAGEVLRTNDHAYYAIVQQVHYEFNHGEADPLTRVGLMHRLKGKRTREGTIQWMEDTGLPEPTEPTQSATQ